ncbi:hypothetical protein NL529_29975, partial [Klebsiella pneumoniae]|nr:hypothetical protein [Klebsiella pneumoniae]
MSERMILTDARLEQALASRVPPTDDGRLLAAIIDAARLTPQSRRPWWARRPRISRRIALI